ncbi:MAG: galactitol-1-phosphate 5-dehydrogenase [Planctomycetaceae bacterium]|nr:galactitol-1-phosphate 5-dehydrogenase [Planctomycetaceae bacterium]
MRAQVMTEYKRLELHEDFPEPIPGPEDVLVNVEAVGICGSDIHGFDGSTGRRIPPLVMGHEAAGTILEVGRDVRHLCVGQRVALDSTVFCGRCENCSQGRINLCDHRQVLGVSCGEYRRHGAFAQRVAVPARIAYPVPDSVSMEQAALAEAVSVAIHAVRRSNPRSDDACLVVGTGMIGLLVVQALRASGVRSIAAIDLDAGRLELARRFGAVATFKADDDHLGAGVTAWSNHLGPQHVFEVVGAQKTVEQAIQLARKGGHVVLVGNVSPRVEIPLQRVVAGELTLHGSCASAGEYDQALAWMADGRIDVAPIISARCSLSELSDWMERLYQGIPNTMKVVVLPNA